MKAKTAKTAKATKPATKATGKSPVLAKTMAKVVPKAKPKTAARVVIKSAGKVALKLMKVAKPVGKATAKKVAKPPAKAKLAASKPAAQKQVVSKPVIKPASKPAAKKLLPKAKAVVKSFNKPPVRPATKLVADKAVKSAAKVISKAAPKIAQAPAAPVNVKPLPAVVAVPVAAPRPILSSGLPPPPPLKPGRRSSSRALAHMPPPAPMVPTHAPDAAKASYSTMTERVIAPPPHVAAKKDPKLANNWKTKTAQTLTDEEVKAMPDAEYMNDMQMAFFRHKLSILKQDIHNSAGATTEHLREDTVVVPDPADRATIEEEHALELRTRDRERKLLKKIEQSIARIDSGDYGYCDETGEPIGVGRLIARPTASLSLEAQQRRELKQKMFGD